MAQAAGYKDITALNAMLARLEREGIVTRDVRGKRTFAIALGPGRGGRGPRSTSARAAVRRPPAVRRVRATRSKAGVEGAQVAQLLGDELASLRRENDELSRRVDALERALNPPRRGRPPKKR
jgi:hypothetical protein